MREARFAQNRRQRAPGASVRPGPTRPRPLAPTAVHCRVAAGSAGAQALPELAVTAAAHKSHTPGKGGGPHPGNRVVPCQEIRWSSPQEIRWVRSEEITWSSTEEIGWVRTEEIVHRRHQWAVSAAADRLNVPEPPDSVHQVTVRLPPWAPSSPPRSMVRRISRLIPEVARFFRTRR